MGTLLLYPFKSKDIFFCTDKMKAFVAVLASAAAASAGVVPAPGAVIPPSTIVRAPAHDSATIENHRLGGNFAYATAEAHAFAKIDPIVATRTVPVAETTHVHTPAAIRTIQPGAITTTHHVASPVLAQEPIYRQEPVIGPVATHTTYEQPIYKTRTYTHTGVATHTQVAAAPAVTVAAGPAVVGAVGAVGAVAPAGPAYTGAVLGHGAVLGAAHPIGGVVGAVPAAAGLGYGLAGGVIAAAPVAAEAIVAEH